MAKCADPSRWPHNERSAQLEPKPTLTAAGTDLYGAHLDGDGPVAKAAREQVSREMPNAAHGSSSDSHVFEPPDLWQTRISAAFRDRVLRIERINDVD